MTMEFYLSGTLTPPLGLLSFGLQIASEKWVPGVDKLSTTAEEDGVAF